MPRGLGRRPPAHDVLVALADSIPDERDLLVAVFNAGGFRTAVLPDQVAQSVRQIRRLSPALVVSRIMPNRFGIALVAALRSEPDLRSIPALLLTSYPLPRLQDEARGAGADEVLLLPVVPDDLCAVAWGLVRDRVQRRQGGRTPACAGAEAGSRRRHPSRARA